MIFKDKNTINEKYVDYPKKVLNGEILASEYVKLSCKRYLDWFDRDDIYFDTDAVDKVVRFISKLKHSSGAFKDKPFILLPWQFHIVCSIFGWKYKENGLRVTRRAYIEVPRKVGKSALVSALMLYMLIADGEGEAQVITLAPSFKQSQLIFDMSKTFISKLDPKHKIFKTNRDEIKFNATKSWMKCFAYVPDKLDGYAPHAIAIDESEEVKTPDLYNVAVSGMGARLQPLIFCIGTAGFHKEYWYYKQREKNIENLRLNKDDGTLSLIYTIDENDDWTDKNSWIKAIPSLKYEDNPNGTVNIDFIADQVEQAKLSPQLMTGVKTKNLNLWCDAEYTWIPNDNLVKCSKKLNLEDFRGQQAFVGLDLSAVSDLTTISVLIPLDGKFYFWTHTFLPEDTIRISSNEQLYKYWANTNQLIVTPGNVQDLDIILKKVREIGEIVNIQSVGYDSWGSTQLAIKAQETELNGLLTPISQSVGNFSRGHKMLETIILNQSAVIDDNELVRWAFSNIIVKEDINGNCKGQKNFDEYDKKIDPYISMVECLLLYLDSPMMNNELFVL